MPGIWFSSCALGKSSSVLWYLKSCARRGAVINTSCFPALMYYTSLPNPKGKRNTREQIRLVNCKVFVMWFSLQTATSMRGFLFAAFERRACLMLPQHSQQLWNQRTFLSAQHSSERSLCPFLKQSLWLGYCCRILMQILQWFRAAAQRKRENLRVTLSTQHGA